MDCMGSLQWRNVLASTFVDGSTTLNPHCELLFTKRWRWGHTLTAKKE